MRRSLLALLFVALPLLMAPDCVSYGDGSSNPIDPSDCTANVSECLASDLGSRRGGKWGRSVCVDCLEICEGSVPRRWPHFQQQGKDCRWWLYQIVFAIDEVIEEQEVSNESTSR
ncbi:hypothetical protein Hoch_0466 [Haliangium ochraceum DSM 14365]|uniref:Lipoprotein n=1 Tax=Haliangium ochraceum (strain DSM 14365 / JCM 11303 / SMP-2) TaxID=502025 RepID=D0LK73_HALO1|nr:hypothetical protein Hoch_0466 [Haliangium ochraceum DSM 14365]